MKRFLPLSLLLTVAVLTPALAQDLTNNSGTLDLSSGSNNLYVGGNLVNASGVTLQFGTASTVTLNKAKLAHLTVNNTSRA